MIHRMVLLCMAIVTIGLIFITYYKNTDMIEMAVFLFITSGCYLVTMNGVATIFGVSNFILLFSNDTIKDNGNFICQLFCYVQRFISQH